MMTMFNYIYLCSHFSNPIMSLLSMLYNVASGRENDHRVLRQFQIGLGALLQNTHLFNNVFWELPRLVQHFG
ncbi:hypothetical protein AQUCO_03400413v1 [Aquilegia coerulea]|uniref:Uncharacterized protein n=1 Tax=Aquilegia coerulea TaxID=218851 RepID=A0A2G5CZ03_AQUCA|nr:hypothetical protein AQUCO_03400413v1 [Aquilegia coerulea]